MSRQGMNMTMWETCVSLDRVVGQSNEHTHQVPCNVKRHLALRESDSLVHTFTKRALHYSLVSLLRDNRGANDD